MEITYQKHSLTYDMPITIESIAKELNLDRVLAATVNGRLRELSYIITKDSVIDFLGWDDIDAMKIYESTIRYVVAMAIKELYPSARVKFNYSISRSILAVIEGYDGYIDDQFVREVDIKVKELVNLNLTIKRERVSIGEAMKRYEENGMHDKVEILKYREEDYVNLYSCGNYFNYMFGYMLPSTGYLLEYRMFSYHPGFLIQTPRPELGGKIPKFVDEPSFGHALKEVAKWGKIIQGNTIAKMNEYAKDHMTSVEFVNMCETKHNHQLSNLGDQIQANIENIRLIAIAGPSSSGKTTFTARLRIELMSRGIKPVMISIDDYYLPRHEAPKHQDGTPDLEHVDALDVERFNRDMVALIRGQEVVLPHFDFKEGKRKDGRKVKIAADSPIMIEGIHALNEKLTHSIPKHQKYNIYIAPQTQLHIDDHNPISITELRLLRRIVRDQKYRNSSAQETLSMWPSVRLGEFRWIYPNQSQANYVFNSELTYEFSVLKKHAVIQLQAIKTDDEHFITANRLLKFLKYFKDIEDDIVPCNSLLREFIGGSSFHR